jgi:Cu2+-exporting ATPase
MKKTLKVEGMMCNCCEARVANYLRSVPEVTDAGADFQKGEAWVLCTPEVNDDDLQKAVRLSGYRLREIRDPFGEKKEY